MNQFKWWLISITTFAVVILISLTACGKSDEDIFKDKVDKVAQQVPTPTYYAKITGKKLWYIHYYIDVRYDSNTGEKHAEIYGEFTTGFWNQASNDEKKSVWLFYEGTYKIDVSMLDHPEKFYWSIQ